MACVVCGDVHILLNAIWSFFIFFVLWFYCLNQIRETRKAVRDSESGIEKMAVGRHVNDRGHVVTRQRDTRTGDMEENQDYLNFDECE